MEMQMEMETETKRQVSCSFDCSRKSRFARVVPKKSLATAPPEKRAWDGARHDKASQ